MRKIRFFCGYQLVLIGVLLGTVALDQAAQTRLKEKKEYFKLIKESSKEKKLNRKEETTIRVLLMTTDYQSYFHPSVTLIRDGKEQIYDPETLKVAGGRITIPAHKMGIQITSVRRQCGNPIYQGELEIISRPEGLTIINELPLETYLEAVVPSEMPSSYEKEALKAQAVCARTYAWKQMQEGRLKEQEADVDDSVNFQVYQNISPQEAATEAVKETSGQILCQNGEPIQAYYFSTSAGSTSTDEIWGAQQPAPYLKSVPCEFDSQQPWSRWETVITWENLEERARDLSGGTGKLLSAAVTEKNESGAATGLQVITEDGSFMLEEEYEIRQFLSPSGCMITERDGTETEGGILLPSAYITLQEEQGKYVQITGGGYGHGVGMSQNGANEMAKEGYSCSDILNYFFRDVEIQKISDLDQQKEKLSPPP